MSRYQRRAGYIVAVVTTVLVLVVRLALERVLADQARLLPFMLAVMAAAWWGGLRPGLLATFLALFLGVLYVVPPNGFTDHRKGRRRAERGVICHRRRDDQFSL